MRGGIAIIAADDCRGVRLLPQCRARGRYGYMGVAVHSRTIHMNTDEELRVNAPRQEYTSKDSAAAPLSVELTTVGNRATTRGLLAPSELVGECSGATHFVESAQVGFAAVTAGRKKTAVPTSCGRAKPGDSSSTPGCSSPVAIRIAKIMPLGDLTSFRQSPGSITPIGTCPAKMVVSEGRCVRLPVDAPYLCNFGDAPGCQAQCEHGDINSCDVLAFMRRFGKGVPKDNAVAAKLYAKGCERDDAIACASLAELEFTGDGIPKDQAKAVARFERACGLGETSACGNLGLAYATGDGVPADEGRGRVILSKSCNAGAASACLQLAKRMLEAPAKAAGEDHARGRALLDELCEVNDAAACLELGRRAYLGASGTQGKVRAVGLFDKGCRAGDNDACVLLGLMYRQADGVQQDDARATHLMEFACGRGGLEGCFNLGIAYEHGKGVSADKVRAAKLYEQACEGEVARACYYLADQVAGGVGTRRDTARADQLYARACSLGEKEACPKAR